MYKPDTVSKILLNEKVGTVPLLTLDDWAEMIDQICEEHGWNEDPYAEQRAVLIELGREDLANKLPTGKTPSDWAILAVTEIVEAFEEHRNKMPLFYLGEDGKPEGQAIEYADAIIRILHWFYRNNISADQAVALKVKFNADRPYKHGGKII